MSLRYHLRAQKHVRLAPSELGEKLLVGKFGLGGVHIHTDHPRGGIQLAHLRLQHLRAVAAEMEMLTLAGGALFRHPRAVAAIVTRQCAAVGTGRAVVFLRFSAAQSTEYVIGQGYGAVGALQCLAALAAGDEAVVAPSVQKDDGLLLIRNGFGQSVPQNVAEGRKRTAARLTPHIGDDHVGKGSAAIPLLHLDQRIFTAFRFIITVYGWGSRCQQHQSIVAGTAEACHVVGQILGIGIGFVSVLLLLVDDDQSYAWKRRKDGGTGADHHVGQAVADPSPGIVPLTGGEGGVDHRHPLAVAGQEYTNHLGRQGNFRYQNDYTAIVAEYPIDHGQNYSGFTASGNAVQKCCLGLSAFVKGGQRSVCCGLFLAEGAVAHVGGENFLGEWIPEGILCSLGDLSLFQ